MLQAGRHIATLIGVACLVVAACGPRAESVAAAAQGAARAARAPDADWASFEGGPDATHYSPLAQINRDNVHLLTPAWTYELFEGSAAANPLIVDGRMYIVGGGGAVVALDAATGAQIWKRPGLVSPGARGLMYWADGDDRRIVYTRGNHLREISANDGSDIEGVDTDLRVGLGRDPETVRRAEPSTPGRIFENLILLGMSPGEDYGTPVGDIRAFDVRTGALVWTFHTIPLDGEPGRETWLMDDPRAAHGGANAWGGMSVDEARGVLYANTGSATYDYWGVDRPGDNLYADCLLALDARTGELLWRFQIVHHDLWDYESAATPTLMTVEHDGAPVDIVAVAGKTGFLYVFDRVTGAPLWPIEETPVPTDGMEGERVSPTQPISSWPEPFARMTFGPDDVDPAIPEPDRTEWVERVRAARDEGLFTPPTTEPTIQMPGNNGGANYGMTAADPAAGRFYVITNDEPAILQLEKQSEIEVAGATPFERGRNMYQARCAICHGDDLDGQPPAIPSLIDVEARSSPEQLSDMITNGGQRMPAFPDMIGGAYRDLLTYLSGDPETIVAAPPISQQDAEAAVVVNERWRTGYGYIFYKGGDWPAIAPPWSTLTAYDLNTGEKIFTTVVGTNPSYPIEGVKTGLPLTKTGAVVTAGGLYLVATTLDRRLEVLDSATGAPLWSTGLPAAGLGIPAVYAVGGREYIVVPAAASGSPGSHEADDVEPARNAYVAYALPEGALEEGAR